MRSLQIYIIIYKNIVYIAIILLYNIKLRTYIK
jgi:hypothetical protein